VICSVIENPLQSIEPAIYPRAGLSAANVTTSMSESTLRRRNLYEQVMSTAPAQAGLYGIGNDF